jgi:hypothetical protein
MLPAALFAALNAGVFAAWAFFFTARAGGPASTRLAYAGLMSAVQIVAAAQALGIGGVLGRPLLVAVHVACAGAVAAAAWRARRPAVRLRLGDGAAALGALASWENGALALLAAFVIVWLGAAGVLLPPRGIDDLVYHLPPLQQAVQSGRLELLPLELRDHFALPFNGDLLFLWPLVFFHDDRSVDLVQLAVALYGVLVVYALARSCDVERRTAFFVAALFLFTPVVLGQAGSAYVDVIAAAAHLALLLALVRFHRDGGFLHLAVAAAATGFAAGIKYSMMLFLAALQPLLWIGLRRHGAPGLAARRYLGYLLLALPLWAYWPLRNRIATGHAFYPMEATLAGLRFLPETTLGRMARADAPTLLADFLAHPEKLAAHPFQDPGLGSLHGGFGAVFWGLCLPALVHALGGALRTAVRSRQVFPLLFWGQALVGALAFVTVRTDFAAEYTARYILFVVGLGLLALARSFPLLGQLPGAVAALKAFAVGSSLLATIHLAAYQWPSYQIRPAVEDRLHGRRTSDYKYLQQAGWDLPSLSRAWEALDVLTLPGPGWSVYMAAGYSVFWTAPSFGSRLQNRIWNFEKNPPSDPDAFIFHHDRRGRPLHFVGRRITPEAVEADGRFALVTQTPYTRLWVKQELLERSEIAARLADYDAKTFAPVLEPAAGVARLLRPGGVVITSSALGYGLRHLALTGKLRAAVHLVPDGHEDATAARLGAPTAYTVRRPLRGYRSRPIAALMEGGVQVPIYENVAVGGDEG